MEPSTNGHQRCRCFTGFYAVVSYVPEPLGRFLDDLRADLVPGCRLRSHVTILPPRCLAAPQEEVVREFARRAAGLPSFELGFGAVELFETTRVAYLALADGRGEVEAAYRALNGGALAFEEYFPFHPHLTLAQGIAPAAVEGILERASQRWLQLPHGTTYPVQSLALVRNVSPDHWETVAECALEPATLLRTA